MAEVTPGFDITLPKRGKLRVTTVEEADEVIRAASAAKEGFRAAQAAIARVMEVVDATIYCGDVAPHSGRECELDDGHDGKHRSGLIVWEREPLPQRTPGSALAPDGTYPPVSGGGVPYGRSLPPVCAAFASPGLTAPDAPVPDECLICGHPERSHDNGPEPYHATSEPRCEAYDDDGGGNGWVCNAQKHHGGPDHINYIARGEAAHRWPVTDDYHPSRWNPPQQDAGTGAAQAQCPAGLRIAAPGRTPTLYCCQEQEGHPTPHRTAGGREWLEDDANHVAAVPPLTGAIGITFASEASHQ